MPMTRPVWAFYLGLSILLTGLVTGQGSQGAQQQQQQQQQHLHVRILIRTQHSQGDLVRSLVWGLRAQAAKVAGLTVDFILIPTEPNTLPALLDIQESLSSMHDVEVHYLEDSFFDMAGRVAKAYRCTRKQRSAYRKEWGLETTVKYCDYDNHVYYQATDRGLQDVIDLCERCTHVLVTNGDNAYHPNFLQEALEADKDLVAVDFTTQAQRVDVNVGVGGIDLGAVLFTKSILRRIGGYTLALPPGATAKDVHDADYWFVQKGVDVGGSVALLHRVLFYHH